MATDINLNQTMAGITPPAIVSKIRFDPAKRNFTGLLDGICFSTGGPNFNEESVASRLAAIETSASHIYKLEGVSEIIKAYGTAVTLEKALWPKLPTIADYVDLDTLYDMDEVQSAFYEATKRQGW